MCHRAGPPQDLPTLHVPGHGQEPWQNAVPVTAGDGRRITMLCCRRYSGSRQLNKPELITAAAPDETQVLLGHAASSAWGEMWGWQCEVL